jgi:hypothetical protein
MSSVAMRGLGAWSAMSSNVCENTQAEDDAREQLAANSLRMNCAQQA